MIIKKWWSGFAKQSPVLDYCIDYPSEKHGVLYEGIGCVVQGWVVFKSSFYSKRKNTKPYLSLKINENLIRRIPLDRSRPDVLEKVFSTSVSAVDDAQIDCGFRLVLPLSGVTIPLNLHVGDQVYELAVISLPVLEPDNSTETKPKNTPNLKVLKGTDDWLFLDNDTNFSVDQHRGLLTLSKQSVDQWQRYIHDWEKVLQDLGRRALFLIAPTKESVLGKYHPYMESSEHLFDPVFQNMPPAMYLHPAQALGVVGDSTFYKTDTHWTHQGAQVTTTLVAQRLGLDESKVGSLFAEDRYEIKPHVGDLGSKLLPVCAQPALFLVSFSYRPWVVYDNALQNFGRIIVIEYEHALMDATCLIFGSSSSYSIFSFICRLFKRIVFVHTAGNIDKKLIEKINPDYFIAQTNARFMIRPPSFDYDVLAIIKEKKKNRQLDQQHNQIKHTVLNDKKKPLLQHLGLDEYIAL